MKVHGVMEINFHTFLTNAVQKCGPCLSRRFTRGENPSTHLIGGWVDCMLGSEKFLVLNGKCIPTNVNLHELVCVTALQNDTLAIQTPIVIKIKNIPMLNTHSNMTHQSNGNHNKNKKHSNVKYYFSTLEDVITAYFQYQLAYVFWFQYA